MPSPFRYLSVAVSAAVFLSASFVQGVQAQERYIASADGQEITDNKTGLIWKRCAEGMTWKVKVCIGQALFFNQPDAAVRAKASGGEWRLPILKELSSIVSVRNAQDGKAAIDPGVFPSTPVARFWTASSTAQGYFTYIGFSDGTAGESPRVAPGAVRLVRTGR